MIGRTEPRPAAPPGSTSLMDGESATRHRRRSGSAQGRGVSRACPAEGRAGRGTAGEERQGPGCTTAGDAVGPRWRSAAGAPRRGRPGKRPASWPVATEPSGRRGCGARPGVRLSAGRRGLGRRRPRGDTGAGPHLCAPGTCCAAARAAEEERGRVGGAPSAGPRWVRGCREAPGPWLQTRGPSRPPASF